MANEAGAKPQREIGKMKAGLRKLEREKQKLQPQLGNATYQAFIEGRLKDDVLLELCREIKSIDDQISQGEAEIARLKQQIQQMKAKGVAPATATCPHCGAALLAGSRFCPNCGKEQTAPPAPAQSCPSCGSHLEAGAAFCGECGRPMSSAPAPPPGPPPSPAPPPGPPPLAQAAPEAKAGEAPCGCPSCGAEADEGATFCGDCGAKLG